MVRVRVSGFNGPSDCRHIIGQLTLTLTLTLTLVLTLHTAPYRLSENGGLYPSSQTVAWFC